jgi:deazaflavin-dependent oxidoreductase (nitroreductase family)
VPLPMFALIETTGRRSGKPRRTPVINGLDGDHFWIVAEHGHAAGYVKNLAADSRVRIKVRRQWRTGLAQVLVEDDAMARARWMAQSLGRWHFADEWAARTFGTEPLTIKVELDPK